MRPNASLASLAVPLLVLLTFPGLFFPQPVPVTGNLERSTVGLDDFRGASPRRASLSPAKNVLRLVVSRKPVAYSMHPGREDALNFLDAYVTETLECGHQLDQFFNPPVEPLIAKRRRCAKCQPQVIEFPARDAPQRKAA